MPRIEPIKLLKCLSGCLSPNGGIKSRENVETLVKLMTKYSKKLVSKCIYIQVLKYTETELLGLFMGSGGWCTIHMWLTESIAAKNWPLVRELLELLLLCPVNIERLKTNNCPKLVKELSKDGNDLAIRALASKLVEQWLKTVKGGESVSPIHISEIPQIVSNAGLQFNDIHGIKSENCLVADEKHNEGEHKPLKSNFDTNSEVTIKTETEKIVTEAKYKVAEDEIDSKHSNKTKEDCLKEKEALPVLKISVKDGKQIISKVCENDKKHSSKSKHKDKSEKSISSSSKSSSSSKHSSRSGDKHRSSSKSSSNRSSSPTKHRSKESDKDKSKEKEKSSSHSSSKHKHSDSKKSSTKSSSSSSKDDKKRSSESKSKKEDKLKPDSETQNSKSSTDKPEPPSIHKLGRIPKLEDAKKEKHSISIEVRKPDEPKPKTVKTFHSKFRKHGLEEEIKPPPSRAALLNKKTTPVVPPIVPVPKRPSPLHNETPPEKKIKIIEQTEKPGSIKLIPPKPKPMMLQESDMFMDALNASSATNKKEPKKRKRRISGSKDGNSNDSSPPTTPTTTTSPSSESKHAPLRFYQDTLDADDEKDKSSEKELQQNEDVEHKSPVRSPTKDADEDNEPHTLTINGLKGVLCYHKRKGPKKSIKWKPEPELEEIQYFELDETERVNVTKTFTDMKYLERINEREAFQKARNLPNDDVMEEKTLWRPLIPIDTEGQIQVDYGKNSKEKEIQAIRQKGTLQPLYFHKAMIPDSPLEPDVETHTYSEPVTIPLEDVTGNTDNISDYRNMPWPEPKGPAPVTSNNLTVPSLFTQNIPQFPNNFGNPPFPIVPGFQGPSMPGEWPNAVAQMLPNGIPGGPLPPGIMPPGGMAPGLMVPPENMMMTPEMFNGPNPMFVAGPPDGFAMMDNMNSMNMPPSNMFANEFNIQGGQIPNTNEIFPNPGNFRGAMRGRGSGHWRGKGPGNWDGPPRGRGAHARGGNSSRKALCIYFQRKGSCRQGDNCTFLHPGVNCPF